MKILHTSDWHFGRTLYSKKERNEEHTAFLNWLLETLKEKQVDLLLVAGDVFDTSAPGISAQKMYYDFLIKVRTTGCRDIIVVGGNHDSPSFLNAPKDILAAINVRVIGNTGEKKEDEVIIVKDNNGKPAILVCAVPFLRERDISRFAEGENYSDRSKRINSNIKKHYEEIAEIATRKREELGVEIPIIATGHLSVAGGQRNEDDGVRETYIGNIEAVGSDVFPEIFDYVALGHYHIPSVIKSNIRYSGSPIPMGFGEATQKKSVYLIEYSENSEKNILTIDIPVFQKMESISGDKNFIMNRLSELKSFNSSVWVEIIYKGDEIFPELSEWANQQILNSQIEILKIQNKKHLTEFLATDGTSEMLDELDTFEVFDKLLEKNKITEEQRSELKESYKEIVDNLNFID